MLFAGRLPPFRSCRLWEQLRDVELDTVLLGGGLDFGPPLHGYLLSLVPSLDRRVVDVIELPGHFPNTAEAIDHLAMGFHDADVRRERTFVNGENVQRTGDKLGMAKQTVGEKLIALRTRAGLSLADVAKRMGLGGRSSVQRLFSSDLEALGPIDALRLAAALEGAGDPPIKRSEILDLCAFPMAEVRPNPTLPPQFMDLPRDVPVYGTAMGTYRTGGEGQEVEEAFVDRSEVIEYFARPPGYANRKGLYGLYVAGSSMEPRWESGDPLYLDPKRPPQIGDDVVVYLKHPEGEEHELEAVLLKRLVRMGAANIDLEQFNPPAIFPIDRRRISAIHRVIPRRELLAFH